MALLKKLEDKAPFSEILEAVQNTDDFTGCLALILKNYPEKKELRDLVFAMTEDYKDCLRYAVYRKETERDFIETLLPLTKDFTFCLRNALLSRPEEKWLIDILIPLTTDFSGCFVYAVPGVEDEKLLAFLASKTESIGNIESIVKETSKIEGALLRLVRSLTSLPKKMFASIDFGESLRFSIATEYPNREAINFFLERGDKYAFCLRNLLHYHPGERDLVSLFMEKTEDFTDCLYFGSAKLDNSDEVIASLIPKTEDLKKCFSRMVEYRPRLFPLFIEEMLKKGDVPPGTLTSLLACGAPVESKTFLHILKNEKNLEGALAAAICNRPGRTDLASMVFAKSGWKKTSGVSREKGAWLPQHLQEMFLIHTVVNDECFICFDTFEEGDEEKVLPCGHRIHKLCDVAAFVCRSH